jgi:hypothetical protein
METPDTLREPMREGVAIARMSSPPALAEGRTPQHCNEAACLARMLTDLTPNETS